MKAIFFILCFFIFSSFASAEEINQPHQYQFSLIPDKNAIYIKGLIIDAKTGDVWQYLSQPPSAKFGEVEGIRYLGKLRVGKEGERIIGNFGRE
jgi:hypothetical protein